MRRLLWGVQPHALLDGGLPLFVMCCGTMGQHRACLMLPAWPPAHLLAVEHRVLSASPVTPSGKAWCSCSPLPRPASVPQALPGEQLSVLPFLFAQGRDYGLSSTLPPRREALILLASMHHGVLIPFWCPGQSAYSAPC